MKWFKRFRDYVKKCAATPAQDVSSWTPNFTPRAQQVLNLATKEAARLHHNFVGTESILLGIIRLGKGCAFNVLLNLGIKPEELRQTIETSASHGPNLENAAPGTYTPRVKKVLAIASNEAKSLHHHYVGTEHLLLGLLIEDDGVAGKILRENCKLNPKQLRIEVLKELDPNFGAKDKKPPS